jgi:hypothetical protein
VCGLIVLVATNTVRVHTEMEGRVNSDMIFEFVSADQFQKTHDGRMITFSRVR